jgi:hypothetical protein
MCVSCAWAKPAKTHPLEFCENGAKATAWEITSRRADRAFFDKHPLRELELWTDHDLEEQGRLTHPMRWDTVTDKYVPVSWSAAFEEIGRELRALDPHQVDLYTSGRASLETSYMYQLFARMYGSNNMPDSSNMCHESSSVALPESIGASVGTAVLSDFQNTDCIFYIAQNVGTSSPRLLHDLQDAVDRGVKIVTFNLLRERGLERFVNPQSPAQMLTGKETKDFLRILSGEQRRRHRALFGVCKALIEADDALKASHQSRVAGDDGNRRIRTTRQWLPLPPRSRRPTRSMFSTTTSSRSIPPASRNSQRRTRLSVVGAGAGLGPQPGSDDAGRRHLRQIRCRHDGLRHGPDATAHGRAERSYGLQSRTVARQYRQSRAPTSVPSAAIRTFRDSGPSASPRSRAWRRSTSCPNSMASSRRAGRAARRWRPARRS